MKKELSTTLHVLVVPILLVEMPMDAPTPDFSFAWQDDGFCLTKSTF